MRRLDGSLCRSQASVLALLYSALGGCGTLDPPAGRVIPDIAAITIVGEDAYLESGRARRVLFLECPGAAIEAEEVAAARSALEERLGLAVRPIKDACLAIDGLPALTPVLCEAGEIGTEITLRWIEMEPDGVMSLQASVGYSGLDGVFIRYRLRQSEAGWEIVEREHLRALP